MAEAVPEALFQPPELGLAIDTWDDLPKRKLPTCSECERPLRSEESKAAQIGPCCAAKIGRAVVARRNRGLTNQEASSA